jgi:hypothetical protein
MATHITRVDRKVNREGEAADLSLPLPLLALPLECEGRCSTLAPFSLFHQHSLKDVESSADRSKTELVAQS